MTKAQLELLKAVLGKITNPDGKVKECLANIDRDLALRQKQKEAFKDNLAYDYQQDY